MIEVKGRIDRIEADFMTQAIATAVREGSQVLIIQLDSPSSILPESRFAALIERLRNSAVPVAVWVGPSGAQVSREATRLVRAAAISAVANGAHVGSMSAGEAVRAKVVDQVTPTLGDFIVGLDGVEVAGRTLRTADVVQRNGGPRREPIAPVRFAKLDLVGRVLHATTNPWLPYALVVFGLLLIVFEFYSVGVGLAGVTGALCVALSAYGLSALGATPVGLALIGLGAFGYAVDVQAGTPRAWTLIGAVSFIVGSWVLYPADRRPTWWTILIVLGLAFLFAVRGMSTMVRARFSASTIGRASLIGEAAEAATVINPEGTVRLRGALWRARVDRATPIEAGRGVKVVAIDGLVLEVEPDDGACEPESAGGA